MKRIKIDIKTPTCEVQASLTVTDDGYLRMKGNEQEAMLYVIRDLLSGVNYSTVTVNVMEG